MRGKVDYMQNLLDITRIIPAYAGKSITAVLPSQIARDHPRACGEKRRTTIQRVRQEGSPPRVRGKAGRALEGACIPGITPAYAGKSLRLVVTSVLPRDHPRVCGEKAFAMARWDAAMGSPPRMRGKDVDALGLVRRLGITPAYAGKRRAGTGQWACRRDHPRVCGEKRTTAGRSSGACAATSNAIGMVTSALYRSAMSYTKEHSCPTCTNPSPGSHPSATMTAWASPYRQACTVGHTGAGAEQQHRNARHIIHGCFLCAGWSSGQGRRLCRGQCPDTASPGTLPGRSPAGCPHRSPPAM